jgi:uncharacterized protein (DUF1778 family)
MTAESNRRTRRVLESARSEAEATVLDSRLLVLDKHSFSRFVSAFLRVH